PNNAVVTIVGDVDPNRIIRLAEKYFGKIPRSADHTPVVTREPQQRGERRVVVEWDAQPELRIGYHVPEPEHPDAAALTMLSHILTTGRTSRLFDRLVIRERKASRVSSAFRPGSRYPRLLAFDVVPIQPTTTEELERIVFEEIERLKTEPPSEEEVQKIRNQVEAGEVRRLQSNLGIAFQLAGSHALYNDWRETFRQSQRLQAVRPEDVLRVAQKYLAPENRTVATLVTKKTAPEAAENTGGTP
ncbi:MAG: insulinase family protein, partial [Gemmatimonadetes bacterium]|nr:insulinase family protein [Gemmatimonadota bacterium]